MNEINLKTTITTMLKEKVKTTNVADKFIAEENLDISYEVGIKYFGSMMERILNSIERIETHLENIREKPKPD